MEGRRLSSWSALLLVIVPCCLCVNFVPVAEGTRGSSEPSGPLTLQADQATHGRPSQQHLPQNGYYEPRSPSKDTYGLRIEPLSESKKSKIVYDASAKTVAVAATPRTNTVRRVVGVRGSKTTTTENPPKADGDDGGDSMVMADAGGKSSGAEDGGSEEKKTLAQQVADGKYGLIQELLPNNVERPGVISYATNPEVPKDTAENLGGLGQEDIWLAEDHVLVLAGGSFRDKGGGLEQPWPPIDDYKAPRRQVKIPAKPSVPPPFPVQLREGEPLRFIGDNGQPFHLPPDPSFQTQGNYPTGSGPQKPGPWTGDGSLPAQVPNPLQPIVEPGAPNPEAPLRPQAPGERPPYPPPPFFPYPAPPFPPQNANFTPPLFPPIPFLSPENLTEPFDEDDPSIYYPPPYDFYYPSDNSTEIPPGPLVPGIVLPPPPDFFSPLNETFEKEASPAVDKELPAHKTVEESTSKPKEGIRSGYRPGIPAKIRRPTSTPGPKYLPVTTKTRDEISYTTQRQRPVPPKTRPTLPTKVLVQENPNQVTPAPQLEVIPVRTKAPPIAQVEPANIGTGRETPSELSGKYHNVQEKYPIRTNQQTPLYYYNGPGISQAVVTSSPRPIYVEEFYQRPKGGVTSPAPPKSPRKQIIYIFTSPEHQDVIENQVSSTEFPQALREHHKYEYIQNAYEDERQAKSQGAKLRYRPDVPTPPRLENFHSYFQSSNLNGQYYNAAPSSIDNGSNRGFRFPDQVPNTATASVSSRPSNYYFEEINDDIQKNPVIYYSIPASKSEGLFNKTHDEINAGASAATSKPPVPYSDQAHDFGSEIYVPQTNNYDIHPVTYRPQVHYAYQDAHRGNEGVAIVTPNPVTHYADPISTKGSQRKPTSLGNEGVSIVTVKPSVLYSSSFPTRGSQNSREETNNNSGVSIVTPRPTVYYSNPVANSAYRSNPQTGSNSGVSIVTSKPYVYSSSSALNDGVINNFQDSGTAYYSNQSPENGNIRNPQRTRYNARPSATTQNPLTFYSNSGAPGGGNFGQNGNDDGEKYASQNPQIYVASSTPSPPKLQGGTNYFYSEHSGVRPVTVTPSTYYHTTQRTPKYINNPYTNPQTVTNTRKKAPTAQYQEYFQANGSPSQVSQLSQINNYNQGVTGGVYIQTTTSPTVQTNRKPSYESQRNQFNTYNQGAQNYDYIQNTPSTPVQPTRKPSYASQLRQYNNYNQGIRSNVRGQSTPSPPVQTNRYQPQVSHISQSNSYNQAPQREIYIQTTPSPVQYQYAENQDHNNRVTTPTPNFASVFNFPSSTLSPLPSYYTTQDVNLFDDVTKNYFTIFGQKIGGQNQGQSGVDEAPRYRPTTPLPPLAEEFDDRGGHRGSFLFPTSRPTTEAPEEQPVVSLIDDIRVNFRNPLPPINPDSEFIVPVQRRPPDPSPSPPPALQSGVRGGGAVVSYQLPGVDGKGVGGGSHYYFLTPQPASSDTRPRPFQENVQNSRQNNAYYQQRPVFNNYWAGYRPS